MKLLHTLIGHKWLYGDWAGMQSQPTKRVCQVCGRIETYRGPMYFESGLNWYQKNRWRTAEQWAERDATIEKKREIFKKLTNTE